MNAFGAKHVPARVGQSMCTQVTTWLTEILGREKPDGAGADDDGTGGAVRLLGLGHGVCVCVCVVAAVLCVCLAGCRSSERFTVIANDCEEAESSPELLGLNNLWQFGQTETVLSPRS